jgi:hypothetical protein
VARSDSGGECWPRLRTVVGGGWRRGGVKEQRRRCVCGGESRGAALGQRAWQLQTAPAHIGL